VNVTLILHFPLAGKLGVQVVADTAKSPVVSIAMLSRVGLEPLLLSKFASVLKVCAGATIVVAARNINTIEAVLVTQEIGLSAFFTNFPPLGLPD
jgi:hypothetical protein